MKKIIYLIILNALFFTSCKDATINASIINEELVSKTNTFIDTLDEKNDNFNIVENNNQNNIWSFYKVSEKPLVNLNNMTRDEIFKLFKEIKIHINDKMFKIDRYWVT